MILFQEVFSIRCFVFWVKIVHPAISKLDIEQFINDFVKVFTFHMGGADIFFRLFLILSISYL